MYNNLKYKEGPDDIEELETGQESEGDKVCREDGDATGDEAGNKSLEIVTSDKRDGGQGKDTS